MDDSMVPRKARPGNTAAPKTPPQKVEEEDEEDADNGEDKDEEEEMKEGEGLTTRLPRSRSSVGGMEVAEDASAAASDLKGLAKCLALGMTHFKSYSEIPEPLQKKYKEFLFPPTPEEAEWMHLGE
jgi:hypothetical protein